MSWWPPRFYCKSEIPSVSHMPILYILIFLCDLLSIQVSHNVVLLIEFIKRSTRSISVWRVMQKGEAKMDHLTMFKKDVYCLCAVFSSFQKHVTVTHFSLLFFLLRQGVRCYFVRWVVLKWREVRWALLLSNSVTKIKRQSHSKISDL